MGFPGVLNTIGTLLDRSQTIKQIFKKCQKMKGPMGPMGLGPKTIKLLKSLKNHENHCFFSTWKRCASRFCEGSTERQLQIMELFGANCVFGNL